MDKPNKKDTKDYHINDKKLEKKNNLGNEIEILSIIASKRGFIVGGSNGCLSFFELGNFNSLRKKWIYFKSFEFID